MKISCKARYAIMAMVYIAKEAIASHSAESSPVSLKEISQRQDLPLSFLEQLFGKLKKSALVKSIRGNQGGYQLAREAHDISILDIILAVEGPLYITRCSPSSPKGCKSKGERCDTHDLWDELGALIRSFLQKTTLTDVCQKNICSAGMELSFLGDSYASHPAASPPALSFSSCR